MPHGFVASPPCGSTCAALHPIGSRQLIDPASGLPCMTPSTKLTELPPSAAHPADSHSPVASDDAMYERLLTAIQEHRLLPGTRLGEDKLASIFGVSRTRVRPILVRLAHDKLINLRPHRSAEVASPTAQEAREVFEVRRMIEPLLVARFIEHGSDAHMAQLQQCLRNEQHARETGQRHVAIRQSGQFHQIIANGAQHDTMAGILHDMVARSSLVIMLYGRGEALHEPHAAAPAPAHAHHTPTNCACPEHQGLVQAMAARNTALATQRMHEHLLTIEQSLHMPHDSGLADLGAILVPERL